MVISNIMTVMAFTDEDTWHEHTNLTRRLEDTVNAVTVMTGSLSAFDVV